MVGGAFGRPISKHILSLKWLMMGHVWIRWVLVLGAALAAMGGGLDFALDQRSDSPSPMAATGRMGLSLPDVTRNEPRIAQVKRTIVVVNCVAPCGAP